MTTSADETTNGYTPHPGVLEAEIAVAGAAMTKARFADAAAELLRVEDFYDLACSIAFMTACDLSGSGQHVDELAVRNRIVRDGNLGTFGTDGMKLFELIHRAAVGEEAVRYHAEIVRVDAIRRRMQSACVRGVAMTGHPTFELEHVDRILDDIQGAMPDETTGQPLWIDDDLDEFVASLSEPVDETILKTPWPDFDEKVTMRTGQLVIGAARPGGGKSIFGLNVACHTAIECQEPALVASLEMSRLQLEQRMYASVAKVPINKIEKRILEPFDWDRINAATKKIRHAPLVIDDQPNVTLGHLRARLRWMARTKPARLLVVDYLQLMTATRKAETRALEVSEFTRGLKVMAKELDVCIIALAQVNRAVEQRANKSPILADLRESGSIENDADTVVFMNPEPEDPRGGKRTGEVDMCVRKQRSGPNDIDIPLAFQGHYARFRSMSAWND
jgi:replicative DNA helicase